MRKWWWLPGWRKNWKLEKRRIEALSEIIGERLDVEAMAQRPRRADDMIEITLLEKVLKRITEIEASAKQAAHIDDLDDLTDDAKQQGQFRGYLCPVTEIHDEGELVIDLVEEWGVPEIKIKKLRDLLGSKLEKADTNPEEARSALRALFEEQDSWEDYTEEYEDTMQGNTLRLFGATLILLPLAVLAFHFAFWFSPLLFLGLLCAGAAGSCVSIMAKMPAVDVWLSAELEAYGRRILTRLGIGVVASLIGCSFLSWFPISIQNQTFADALNACVTSPATCTGIKSLLLLGVPMLLGFSERTLTSVEQRVFGSSHQQLGR